MKISDALINTKDPERLDLIRKFSERFPEETECYISRAPGRVNLIGEHIDYNGYGVMPMALNREIICCFAPSSSPVVEIYDSVKEDPFRTFSVSGDIEPYKMGDWGNYIKAPCQAMFRWAKDRYEDKIPLMGFKAVFMGNIPPAAGLSSSSAIVVCIGAIVSFINRLKIGKSEFADLMAKAEFYVGTMGGGMDQTASVFGHSRGPLRIKFKPIRVDTVLMPEGYSFIIANSMKKAKKSGEARYYFNDRSISCKFGLEILRNITKEDYPDTAFAPSLRRLQKLIGWEKFPKYFEKIPKHPLSVEEISSLSGISVSDIRENYLKLADGEYLPVPPEGFKIYDRLLHVFTEAKRVSATKNAMEKSEMDKVAEYMDESHASCRDLYEISTPEVEKLISCLKIAGTMGSRITGAGWGGCTVSLVRKEDAQRIIDEVWQTYYLDFAKGNKELTSFDDKNKVIFECVPQDGAEIIK
ncbi:MAG: galactokinase [Armatimonadetes bacterium]|nr:galactokinase [Candidatus Hippobium faecium]